MKIAFINSVYKYGSTGRIVEELARMAESEGHEARIFYGRKKQESDEISMYFGSRSSNILHVLVTRIFDNHGLASKRKTRKLLRMLDEYKPDVLHLHNLHGYYINIKILFDYIKRNQTKTVWTLHDCWALTGHCTHFDYMQCSLWRTECHRCPQKKDYPASYIFDNSKVNHYRKKEIFKGLKDVVIVTPSEWLKKLVSESLLEEYPCHVIPNGIDTEVFRPLCKDNIDELKTKWSIPKDKKIVLGVANVWSEKKGLNTFIKLSKELDNSLYQIVLVGLNSKQIRALQKTAPKILRIKRTNDINELVELYNTADIFINPTLEETFGLTNIEALTCGIPVITFDTGGSPESLNNECGVVVEKGNYDALLDAVAEYCINRPNVITCRERAKIYEKNTQYMEYIRLYKLIYGQGIMD